MRHKRISLWVMAVIMMTTPVTQPGSSNRLKVDNSMSDKKVLDELLNKTRYDKRLRPPARADGVAREGGRKSTDPSSKCINSTIVSANVVVLSLSSPDESSLKYEVEFLMHQHWQDSRLSFEDHYSYEFLNGIHHQEDIWIPDTYFVKHGDFIQVQLPSNIALRIFRDGSVKYTIRRLLSLACEGDLNIFPFDDPKCSFAMESVSYERDEMEYRWKESDIPPLYFLPDMHILNAYIISNETQNRCDDRLPWRGNYSCLKVHLTFTRDKSYYFSTVFIPGMLLVTSSFITFWLEWNAVPGRVMLGVTTMLNFFTTSNNFRATLPVVSNLTAMNVWDGVCMCFIYASLLEFVAVNYLGRKKPRGLRCYRTVSTTIAVKQNVKGGQVGNHENYVCNTCPPNQCIHTEKLSRQPIIQDTPKVPFFDLAHPLRVAKTIDVVSRVVFPVAYGVFLIFFFARYNGFS